MEQIFEYIMNNQAFAGVVIGVSLTLNIIIGLKPVVMYIVKKTKTDKDDKAAEKIYKLLDGLSEKAKQKLLDKIT